MTPQSQKQQLTAAVCVGACLACFAVPASALPVTVFDFAMYGGGGITTGTALPETRVGSDVQVYGSVGSNQDVEIVGGALVTGDVLAKGSLRVGSNAQIGVSGSPVTVISNLDGDFNGTVFGNIHAGSSQPGSGTGLVSATLRSDALVNGSVFAKRDVDWTANSAIIVTGNETLGGVNTGSANQVPNGPGTNKVLGTITTGSTAGLQTWAGVSMPAASIFTAGGVDQSCSGGGCSSLTLAPGTYGDLDIGQNKTLRLSSGNYYFDKITVNSGLDLELDLSSGGPLNIFVVGVANFGQDQDVFIKKPGGASFVQISLLTSTAEQAASSLVYLETLDTFNINSGSEWAGTIYASKAELGNVDETYVGTTTTVWGALYAYDSVDVHQDSVVNYVRSYLSGVGPTAVPVPPTLLLLGAGLLALVGRRKRA